MSIPFPDGTGLVIGTVTLRYWGKKDNLILLLDTYDGHKLKFSFWKNTGYCIEPVPYGKVDTNESVKYLTDGSLIELVYERKKGTSVTRVRELRVLKKSRED